MRILIDMDDVIADFEKGFLDKFRKLHPDKPYVPLEKRTTFYLKEQYPEELGPLIEAIYFAPGFYLSLLPIPGSLEALSEIKDSGNEVFICTSPLSRYENCILEKYQWVDENLGNDWIKRLIVAKDKTVIRGDILIDDKPEIKGVETPSWEHVLYSQPYNAHIDSKRRLTWQDWKLNSLFSK